MLSERAQVVADAAIAVLGEQGSRALTHRAVDRRAGLAAGSTSNVARSRAALLALTVERIMNLDAATYVEITERVPTEPVELARLLARAVHGMLATDRTRMVARYELSMEAIRRPELQREMARAGDALRLSAREVLVAIGSPEPDRHSRQMNALLEGMVFHTCVDGRPRMTLEELTAVFREFLTGMLR